MTSSSRLRMQRASRPVCPAMPRAIGIVRCLFAGACAEGSQRVVGISHTLTKLSLPLIFNVAVLHRETSTPYAFHRHDTSAGSRHPNNLDAMVAT